MNDQRESLRHTFAMAIGVALACSLLVTAAVQYFRPLQLAYAALERNRIILRAGGVLAADEPASDRDVASAFRRLDARLVDLRTGEFSTSADALLYDYRAAAQDTNTSAPIPAGRDVAKLGRRAHLAPVYIRREDDRLVRIVLPVSGQGMWSTIHGYIALGPDLNTIEALTVFEHQETPGIGDRIEDPAWLTKWAGKRAYDEQGVPRVGVAKDIFDPISPDAVHTVDAISGATVTADGVTRMVRFWLGPDGFGPFLNRLRELG